MTHPVTHYLKIIRRVSFKEKNITSYVYSKQKIFEFSRQKSTMMCDINASKTMNDLLFLCILKLSLPNGC